MQIHSVQNTPKFSGQENDRALKLAYAPDSLLKKIAYHRASVCTDDYHHRKLTNLLYCSVPLAAAVSAAVLTKEPVQLFNSAKTLTGYAAKAANGVKYGAGLALLLGAVDVIATGERGLEKSSRTYRSIKDNHPFITLAGVVAATIGVIHLVGKGLANLPKEFIKPEKMDEFDKWALKTGARINKNEFIKDAGKHLRKAANAIHPSLKGAIKTGLSWSPLAILVGALIHSANHAAVKQNVYTRNYIDLKTRQAKVRTQIELAKQNTSGKTPVIVLASAADNCKDCPPCECASCS